MYSFINQSNKLKAGVRVVNLQDIIRAEAQAKRKKPRKPIANKDGKSPERDLPPRPANHVKSRKPKRLDTLHRVPHGIRIKRVLTSNPLNHNKYSQIRIPFSFFRSLKKLMKTMLLLKL
jgi:hypothetical protein